MSKIAAYRKAKARAERVRQKLLAALGRDHAYTENHNLWVRFVTLDFGVAVLHIGGTYSYKGMSTIYNPIDGNVGMYLARAINEYMEQIAERAIELAEEDVAKARREAEEEAREVLRELREDEGR